MTWKKILSINQPVNRTSNITPRSKEYVNKTFVKAFLSSWCHFHRKLNTQEIGDGSYVKHFRGVATRAMKSFRSRSPQHWKGTLKVNTKQIVPSVRHKSHSTLPRRLSNVKARALMSPSKSERNYKGCNYQRKLTGVKVSPIARQN